MSKLSKSTKTTAPPRPGNFDKNGNARSVLGCPMNPRNCNPGLAQAGSLGPLQANVALLSSC